MNHDELEQEIFDCEDWGTLNRLWFDVEITKAVEAEEISRTERVKLYTLIGDEMERYYR